MPVFEAERPKVDRTYVSPEGIPVQRIAIEAPVSKKPLSFLESLGKTSVARVVYVEVTGGRWVNYSEAGFRETGNEGVYITYERDQKGIFNLTDYNIRPDGSVRIRHLRLNHEEKLEKRYSISEVMALLLRPFIRDARVTLKPVPGSDQTYPVLWYTEIERTEILGISLQGVSLRRENLSHFKDISLLSKTNP